MLTESETKELKIAFAEALLRNPTDPASAAFSVISNTGIAMQAANLWVRDPFVLEIQRRLKEEHGERAFLPTKEDQGRELWTLATNKNIDPDERLKAHRLYAELFGYIEKPQQSGGTTNILNQGVMIVKDHGSDDDWEQRAVAQQRELTGNVEAIH